MGVFADGQESAELGHAPAPLKESGREEEKDDTPQAGLQYCIEYDRNLALDAIAVKEDGRLCSLFARKTGNGFTRGLRELPRREGWWKALRSVKADEKIDTAVGFHGAMVRNDELSDWPTLKRNLYRTTFRSSRGSMYPAPVHSATCFV